MQTLCEKTLKSLGHLAIHLELSLDLLLLFFHLELSLLGVLLMLGFSEVVLSEYESRLPCLTQVSHVLQFAKGASEHVLYLFIDSSFLLFLVLSLALFVVASALQVDGSEQFVHLHDIHIPAVELANLQKNGGVFLCVTHILNALELMIL